MSSQSFVPRSSWYWGDFSPQGPRRSRARSISRPVRDTGPLRANRPRMEKNPRLAIHNIRGDHMNLRIASGRLAVLAGFALGALTPAYGAWEPTKTVEFIVPAGTGGGADQMARLIQSIVAKHNLMKQPM